MSLRTPRSVQDLQQALAGRSKSGAGVRLYSLYDKVYRMDVLKESWRRVKANKGGSGVDGASLADIESGGEMEFLTSLRAELKGGWYKPQALRRVYIPKGKGKKRPLSIPTVKDRVVQQAVRLVIEPIFEAHFLPASFGFRPGRGAHGAVREIEKLLCWGLDQVIETDVENCFGSIPHDKLMQRLAERIADGRILKLVRAWLRCGVLEEGVLRSQVAGTPQGGVISPLLANIYLDRLDRVWRQKGMEARSGHNARLIRYADDVVILTDKSPQEPYRVLVETLSEMGLKAHPDKTRVLKAGESDFDFLGFNFRKVKNPRTGKSFPLVRPSKKAQAALRDKLREKTSPRVQMNIGEVVRTINPVLRGWVNYFRVGHSAKVFGGIRYFAMCRVRKCMRRKQGRAGYGWKRLPGEFFYGTLGLFSDYTVSGRPRPAWAH